MERFQFPVNIFEVESTVQLRFATHVPNTGDDCRNQARLYLDEFSFDLETEWQLASSWSPTESLNLDDYDPEQVYVEEVNERQMVNVSFWWDRDDSNNYPLFEAGPFNTASASTVIRINHQLVKMEDYNHVYFYYREVNSGGWNLFHDVDVADCRDYGSAYNPVDLFFELDLNPEKSYILGLFRR